MSTIYCLLSKTNQQKISGFYRRCLRMIYHLFQGPTSDLHETFRLPTLEEKYRKNLTKRLANIQQHEQEWIACYLMNKNTVNKTRQHYQEESCIQSMPRGRPSTRMTTFYNDSSSFLDKLLQFYNQEIS